MSFSHNSITPNFGVMVTPHFLQCRYGRHLISAGHIQLQQLLTLEREVQVESNDVGCSIERSAPVDADNHEHEDEVIMPQSPISECDVRRFLI